MFVGSATISTNVPPIQYSQSALAHALSSRENLVEYLAADREIQNLAVQAKQLPSAPTQLAYNRWSMAWLKMESISLRCFRRVFKYSQSYLLHYFPNFTKTLQVKVLHKSLQHQTPYFRDLFKENLLTRSLNVQHPDSSDFYLHPALPQIRWRVFENGQYKSSLCFIRKEFLMLAGVCGGMCAWFTYLYFKTLPYYSDPEVHLQTVATLFDNGAPRQAQLLQFLAGEDNYELSGSILGFEIAKECNITPLTLKAIAEDNAKFAQFLKDLPIGVYYITVQMFYAGHALRYFKINEKLGFLFDPNIGLIKLAEDNQHEDLAKMLPVNARRLTAADDDSYFNFHPIIERDENVPAKLQYTISVE